ncbi:MAG: hypothetical protein EBS01_06835 [Verrucomicrobia bacterium]|nr:hypothetical protein [Verrucomicrobiota bacterium]
MTSRASRNGLTVDFKIHVLSDGLDARNRTVFRKLNTVGSLLLRRSINRLVLLLVQDTLLHQAGLPEIDRVVIRLVQLDFFLAPVDLVLGILEHDSSHITSVSDQTRGLTKAVLLFKQGTTDHTDLRHAGGRITSGLKAAIRDNDPVMFMENTLLYGEKGEVPEEEYIIPLGLADLKREGRDVSIIAHGRAVLTALKAAELLQAEHDIHAEVLDLRSIRPLDEEAILRTVRKTHRAVLVEENKPFCGVDAQISSIIMEKCFDDLDAPVLRISAIDAPAIYSPELERRQLPRPADIVAKVLSICRQAS